MRFLHSRAVPFVSLLLAALAVAAASLWLIVPVWLPQKSPAPYVFAAQSTPAPAALLDINTADAAALTALPGVGQAKAEALVRYRAEPGFFCRLTGRCRRKRHFPAYGRKLGGSCLCAAARKGTGGA